MRSLQIIAALTAMAGWTVPPAEAGVFYDAVTDGDWSDPFTWTPSGGPPGLDDGARIAGGVLGADPANVFLSRDTVTDLVEVGTASDAEGNLLLRGFSLSTGSLRIGSSTNGTGTVDHAGGRLGISGELTVAGGNTFTFAPQDTSDSLVVKLGAVAATSATANISTEVEVKGDGSTLQLGAPLSLAEDLDVWGDTNGTAFVQAAGHDISVRDLVLGLDAGPGYAGDIIDDGAIIVSRDLVVRAGSFTLDADDRVTGGLSVRNGAGVTTGAATNVSGEVSVTAAGSRLDLGAALSLTGDITVWGTDTALGPAVLDARGHDITARRIDLGSTYWAGQLTNDGAIQADSLDVGSGSALLLTGGDDVVLSSLRVQNSSALTIRQSLGELSGLTFDGTTLDLQTSGLLALEFDDALTPGLDWAFRWANPATGDDWVGELSDLIAQGNIQWTAPWAVSVFGHTDGYTYIGYRDAQVPEPRGLVLATLLAGVGYLSVVRRFGARPIRGGRASKP